MKHIRYILILACAAILQSCGTYTADKAYNPDVRHLKIRMSDMVCVGETTVEVTYRTYLGFIKVIDTVNGQEYDSTNKHSTVLAGTKGHLRCSSLRKALHKVLEEHPDAEYFQVAGVSKEKQKLFLSTSSKVKATIRVYKFK